MNKILKSALAFVLTLSLCLSSVQAVDLANGKEEVVYIKLDANGNVKLIDVVNIFENTEDIIDYGDYHDLKILNTNDTIDYANDEVSIHTTSNKVYYQGTLNSTVIPWNVDIHYYLNNKELTAEELAGKKGHLKIEFEITRNENDVSKFYESHALQVILSLNTDLCKNIIAADATIANVGTNKQLTYTVLPNAGASYLIEADVVNFECDGFSINAIPLVLDIKIDEDQFMTKIHELQNAIIQLNKGAHELTDGAGAIVGGSGDLATGADQLSNGASTLYQGAHELQNGGKDLQIGTGDLSKGANELSNGIEEFSKGILQVQEGLNTLNSNTDLITGGSAEVLAALQQIQVALSAADADLSQLQELKNGLIQFKDGINQVEDGSKQLSDAISYSFYYEQFKNGGLNIDELRSGNDEAINQLTGLSKGITGAKEFLKSFRIELPLLNQIEKSLSDIVLLLTGSNAVIDNTKEYIDTVHEKTEELSAGVEELNTSYDTLAEGVTTLIETVESIGEQMILLKDGINILTENYATLDQGILDYTKGVSELLLGYNLLASNFSLIESGAKELAVGSNDLYAGTNQLIDGINQIYVGSGSLYDGSGQLKEGVKQLVVYLQTLYSGSKTLSDGTNLLNQETSMMDSTIQDMVGDIINGLTGENTDTYSFVNEKNSNVDYVQFVIQSEQIKKTQQNITSQKTKKLSFWEKLLRLFHLG